MLKNKFKNGSVWNKWDLHIHSPQTFLANNYKQTDWEEWANKIKDENITAIGLTNYFKFNNNEIETARKHLKDTVTIFPNLEFRLQQANQKNQHINIHIIFSDKIDLMYINGFLGRLKTIDGKYCSDLTKNDITNVTISLDTLVDTLKAETNLKPKVDYLIAFCPKGFGSTRPSKNDDGRGIAIARQIAEISNLGFGGESESLFFSKPQKAIVECSDSHSLDQIGTKYTWIKSLPTFEGLKQIVHAPNERINLSKINPNIQKENIPTIESIKIINDSFHDEIIHFNPDLNTIIGGRSTGKSTLLEIIAKKVLNSLIHDNETCSSENIPSLISDDFLNDVEIKWSDGEENPTERKVEYFKQHYMYLISKDSDKRNQLIEKIISKDGSKEIKKYNESIQNISSKISNKIRDLINLEKDIVELKEDISDKNHNENSLHKNIKIHEETIAIYNSSQDISRKENNTYIKLENNIKAIQNKIKQSYIDIEEIDYFKEQINTNSILDILSHNKVSSLSNSTKNILFEIKLREKKFKNSIKVEFIKHVKNIQANIKRLKDAENSIKESALFKKIKTQIDNNALLTYTKQLLITSKELLDIIGKQKEEIKKLNENRDNLINDICDLYISYSEKVQNLEKNLNLKINDMDVGIFYSIQKNNMTKILKNFLNLNSNSSKNILETFETCNIQSKDDLHSFIKEFISENLSLKKTYTKEIALSSILSQTPYYYEYDIKYQCDSYNMMSDGKKAFVILKLLLDYSNNNCPILIDQPEDSLDNRAIYNELVEYIKKKKKERQIIIVTHNANLVVNADAEQVIIANQHGKNSSNTNNKKFQYKTGSLEDSKTFNEEETVILNSMGTREHICDILEGGKEAFVKRENIYNITGY